MSVVPTGFAGSAAGTAAAHAAGQQTTQAESAATESRRATSAQRAEQAGGVAHPEDESQVFERDADGRRPWESPTKPAEKSPVADDQQAVEDNPPRGRDPSGQTGQYLDLCG